MQSRRLAARLSDRPTAMPELVAVLRLKKFASAPRASKLVMCGRSLPDRSDLAPTGSIPAFAPGYPDCRLLRSEPSRRVVKFVARSGDRHGLFMAPSAGPASAHDALAPIPTPLAPARPRRLVVKFVARFGDCFILPHRGDCSRAKRRPRPPDRSPGSGWGCASPTRDEFLFRPARQRALSPPKSRRATPETGAPHRP